MSWYVITSHHACYISEYMYLHIFRVNFLLKSDFSRGHEITCLAHHLEQTDNKPLSRLIGPTHVNKKDNCPLKLVREMLLSHSAIWQKHLNIICVSNGIQTHNHLGRKWTLNHFAKQAKWLTSVVSTYLYGIHLNYRYCACFKEAILWHSGNYRVYIHSEMHTWHDNNIQGLHFPGAIKIVTTMIHYCYCLMAYGKWRPVI